MAERLTLPQFLMQTVYRRPWVVITILLCFFGVGFVGHALPVLRPLMIAITPGFLLVFGVFALWPSLVNHGWRLAWWLGVAWLVTFFLEVLGISTGMVFGAYSYGASLGSHVFGVPPVIGFNWVVVVLGAIQIARRWGSNPVLVSVAAGLIAVGFDFILEPVAIKNDYWSWTGSLVPLQNYIAWFVIASICAWSWFVTVQNKQPRIRLTLRWQTEDVLVAYLLVQASFFFGQTFLV